MHDTATQIQTKAGITPKQAQSVRLMLNQPHRLHNELEQLQLNSINITTWFDANYPEGLKTIHDPPAVIYSRGCGFRPEFTAVGSVGTRGATAYGLRMAEHLAYDLAQQGVCIVSGLAKGIDAAAHRGALQAKGQTLGVVGHGLSVYYPQENAALYDRVAESGAVLSEFPYEREPSKRTFPQRNRIISGLSQAIIVVEAAHRSGALITADFALEQEREVFALPGPADGVASQGTNHLIQQGAHLVQTAEDVLSVLAQKPNYVSQTPVLALEKPILEGDLGRIFDSLRADEAKCIDLVAQECRLPIAVAAGYLLELEMRNLVQQLPGKCFLKR